MVAVFMLPTKVKFCDVSIVNAVVPLVAATIEPLADAIPTLDVPFAMVLGVPAPDAAMLIPPAVLVMVMLAPAVKFARVNPVPLPMSNAPLAGVLVKPVPPLATANVPAIVIVPDVVIGPPLVVRPVDPPLTATLVTVPVPDTVFHVGAPAALEVSI